MVKNRLIKFLLSLSLSLSLSMEKIDLLTAELEQGGSKADSSSKLTVLTPPRVSETDM